MLSWLLAPSSCRGFLVCGCFSAAINKWLQQLFRLSPRCVCAQREVSATVYGPGTGKTKNKKNPKRQTLRPRSFPVVLCEPNHCFEGKRTMSRSFLGCNVVRKKLARNCTTCANANIAIQSREDVEESVATWNSAVGSKVQRKKWREDEKGGNGASLPAAKRVLLLASPAKRFSRVGAQLFKPSWVKRNWRHDI